MSAVLAKETLLLALGGGLPMDVRSRYQIPIRPEYFSPVSLRYYQLDMLLEAALLMRLGYRRILLQLPTGGGKTRMAAALFASTASMALTGEFIVHRKELLKQTSESFSEFDLDHSFVAAGFDMDPDATLRLSGVQTLVKRLADLLPPNLAVIDEAHHATAASWDRTMAAYEPDTYIIGLTATPERLDGRGLDDHFDAMVCGPTVAELIEQGFLSDFDYYAPPGQPDLTGVRSTAGDFNKGAIAELMDKPKLIGDVVEHYQRLAAGQKGIVFASSVNHSRHMAEMFIQNGVNAAHVDGAMKPKERDRVVDAFRDGALDVMTNVDLFGEGFDVPAVVYCGLARPTKALSLYLQQAGRALRVIEGKDRAIICDHAGNAFRHGMPDEDREWSLAGRPKKRGGSGPDDAMPVRQCLICYRVSPSTVQICPGCETEFPPVRREIETEAGTLTKIEKAALKRQAQIKRKIEERQCETYRDFKELAERRGYKNPAGWASVQKSLRRGGGIR